MCTCPQKTPQPPPYLTHMSARPHWQRFELALHDLANRTLARQRPVARHLFQRHAEHGKQHHGCCVHYFRAAFMPAHWWHKCMAAAAAWRLQVLRLPICMQLKAEDSSAAGDLVQLLKSAADIHATALAHAYAAGIEVPDQALLAGAAGAAKSGKRLEPLRWDDYAALDAQDWDWENEGEGAPALISELLQSPPVCAWSVCCMTRHVKALKHVA